MQRRSERLESGQVSRARKEGLGRVGDWLVESIPGGFGFWSFLGLRFRGRCLFVRARSDYGVSGSVEHPVCPPSLNVSSADP